ncbi:HAD family hydrolase [Streptomyces sp. RP5T]|uniref:HAD family hydrolase n=1 Tax=Streptomyces sp. RP5T TaxID=2490848 RepID=UPI0021ADF344|nr:HAD hydrolase-like protein [Streptomyces sp. RP5T]
MHVCLHHHSEQRAVDPAPACRLFAGHSAERVAVDLIAWLESRGLRDLVTEEERNSLNPQVILAAVDRRHPDSGLVAELEQRLTREELRASSSAMPTACADPLIRTWAAVGARLAVTANNSPRTVRSYLEGRGLLPCFDPHIYGRTQDLGHLKPHPHFLNRALNATGTAPSGALMIGDSHFDCHAAVRAGVPFVGYARDDGKERELRNAGALIVLRSPKVIQSMVSGQA